MLTGVLIGVGVLGISLSAPIAAATLAPALAVAFWRNALGALAGAPLTLVGRRGELRTLFRPDPGRRGPGRRDLWLSLLAGLLLAVHFALWIPSLRMTTVTASTALVTTTPVFTVVIDRLRGRRVPKTVVLGVGLALGGVLVITGVDATTSARALTGDLMALGGGAAMAAYVVAGEEVRRTVSTATYTLIAYTCCAAVLLVVCLLGGVQLGGYSTRTWVELAVLTLAAQLLGHSVLNRALRTAGATTVSLAILLEVPGAALIAWVWLDQVPPVAIVPGAALVLAGLVVVVRARSRHVVVPA